MPTRASGLKFPTNNKVSIKGMSKCVRFLFSTLHEELKA